MIVAVTLTRPTVAVCPVTLLTCLLEHPAEALDDYRTAGVAHVICEEKHTAVRSRLGVDDGMDRRGHTRTGRPFFTPTVTEDQLERLRAIATRWP